MVGRSVRNLPPMKRIMILTPLLLAACESPSLQGLLTPTSAPAEQSQTISPQARPEQTLDPTPPPPPPPSARTVEQFDTTTAEDREEALEVAAPAGEVALGTTNASLGSPTDPGIWLKTPLVSTLTAGRVEYPANGNTVNIELRPSGGSAGSASQISLAAMRLLEIPLTELADITVFAQ